MRADQGQKAKLDTFLKGFSEQPLTKTNLLAEPNIFRVLQNVYQNNVLYVVSKNVRKKCMHQL